MIVEFNDFTLIIDIRLYKIINFQNELPRSERDSKKNFHGQHSAPIVAVLYDFRNNPAS